MDARPLRDLLADLVGDASARQAYGTDPAGYLAAHGHPDLPEQLVAEAVVSYADTAPVEVAAALAPYVTAHGPVPDPDAHGDWFDLLTTADVTADDDPFGEQLDVAETPDEWTDPGELDFGAGAPAAGVDHEPAADDAPDDGEAPTPPVATEPEWPVDTAPEPPIAGLPDEDDDLEDDDLDE